LFDLQEPRMHKIFFTPLLALLALVQPVWAHEGHGLGSTHWHATDALGFVVAAALLAAAIYFGKK
jgi:hypothetical protein